MGFLYTVFYEPLYNIYIFFLSVSFDVAIAVVLTVLLIKIIFLPINISTSKTQRKIKEIQPRIKEIQNEYKDDKETQTRELLKIYKENKINPLTSLLTILLQFPFIIALFFLFTKDNLLSVDLNSIYSFITPFIQQVNNVTIFYLPETVYLLVVFSLLAALFQYMALKISLENTLNSSDKSSFSNVFLSKLKVILPIAVFFISLTFKTPFAIYLIVINIAQILQDKFILNKFKTI